MEVKDVQIGDTLVLMDNGKVRFFDVLCINRCSVWLNEVQARLSKDGKTLEPGWSFTGNFMKKNLKAYERYDKTKVYLDKKF